MANPVILQVERASMNISSALVIASLILGSADLIRADNLDRTPSALTTIVIIGFIVAVVAGLLRLLMSKRDNPGKKFLVGRHP